jgi:hypothetical protein
MYFAPVPGIIVIGLSAENEFFWFESRNTYQLALSFSNLRKRFTKRFTAAQMPIKTPFATGTSFDGRKLLVTSLGSIPKREEPGKSGAPCVKVPGSSRVPTLLLPPPRTAL